MTHTFEIKESIEVTFPHFRKFEFFSYKVLSPTKEIVVEYYPHEDDRLSSAAIKFDRICEPNTFRHGSYEITEEEFNETMARAYALINNKNQ